MPTPSKDADGWRRECIYIDKAMEVQGRIREMNFDTGVFIRYCQMQKASAERDGQHDAATHIEHVLHDLTRVL